jgi:protein associated with RNAse G/E
MSKISLVTYIPISDCWAHWSFCKIRVKFLIKKLGISLFYVVWRGWPEIHQLRISIGLCRRSRSRTMVKENKDCQRKIGVRDKKVCYFSRHSWHKKCTVTNFGFRYANMVSKRLSYGKGQKRFALFPVQCNISWNAKSHTVFKCQ